jgi:hypothetical protein
VQANLHYVNVEKRHGDSPDVSTLESGRFSDDYHIYRVDWRPQGVFWYLDGVRYHAVPIADDMKEFLRNFYMILNIAVGGSWPGNPDDSSVFPMRMLVDYVRYYEILSVVDPGEPPLDIDEESLAGSLSEAAEAMQDGFVPFQDVGTVTFGPAAPLVDISSNAVDGALSVAATYPGASWGGVYWELDTPRDMSAYAAGHLVAALKVPSHVTAFEVKLESVGASGSLNLVDYPPVPINADYAEYTIPLADFTALGLDLSQLTIPFALWNPEGAPGVYTNADVLVDNVHFTP